MADGRQFTRDLPVRLNDDELQLYGKLLAIKVQEEEAVDAQKKQVSKEYSTRLGAIRCEQARLADARSKGLELRPVECAERWHAGMIEIVRADTGEVVESRPVTPADQQTQIPGLDDDPGMRSVFVGAATDDAPEAEPFNPPAEKAKRGKRPKAGK